MSCFNCYSSRRLDGDLVDKILDQGQRLRSAMRQTGVKLDELGPETNDKIRAFLQGDVMSREDEVLALETLRAMSSVDLCRATDRTYRSNEPCDCPTCLEYSERDLNCDLKRRPTSNQKSQEKHKNDAMKYLKFVDSLKVSVNSVVLNDVGDKKVIDSLGNDKVSAIGQTYFLEYQIPEVLAKNQLKVKSKVDSGLEFGNIVRLCSRRAHQQAISFKQTSIHDINRLPTLDNISIKFRLSFRNFKQKQPVSLGQAKFEFGWFEQSKNFVCNQELALKVNDGTPLIVGALRLSVQLGCGRLYFGKEFIEAVTNDKENAIALDSDDLSSNSACDTAQKIIESYRNAQRPRRVVAKPLAPRREVQPKPVIQKPVTPKSVTPKPVTLKPVTPKQVLFAFAFVAQAKFSREVLNSYVACQMFGQDEVVCSKSVAFDSNPVYNFRQQIPLVYDEELLLKVRDNFMVVEFFEKGQVKDFLIGLNKLALHQFYLTYRNPAIVKYLSERNLPVIATDGWEPIVNPVDDEVVGQAQILLALGTEEQIANLERERGFKGNLVKARPPLPEPAKPSPIAARTADVGVQSDMEPNKEPQDIETLLSQIVAQKPHNVHVENSTNTEPADELTSTSELLHSLQTALSTDSSFKAHVAINGALHLPSRRKCKSRRSRGRSGKHEDILPSSYVTFESHGEVQVTPIAPKSTSPKWDYRCDVALPVEYLTDNRKFLVFKVWRKSTNTTMTPNMQTDIVIGFATVDLTVLLAGLPSVQGWFNINDLSNKCNGQINIHVTPLENITKYQTQKESGCCDSDATQLPQTSEASDEPSELLGRALKRKFTELDEITQRLRLRLSKVTNDESDISNDEIADEFEHDINTLCVEDDFDTVDFDQESTSFSSSRDGEVALLQTEALAKGKQKIDVLLQKLSLLSAENSSRYVSGCSDGRTDAGSILQDLDCHSRPNLHTSDSFSRDMAQKFGNLDSEFREYRATPEGQGLPDD